ncbi:choice-of-anchor Q domain-containing protein [Lacinutrix mariniflava]|uniref:choice-of-anchor Q domain-containing protein n=1 Tax=Lacinutrix mariniflava TaxID=342955 RepID=UPI0006E17A4D|nr:choice-of-anchor Q domain-containing protein [Lacinutrix mariniflava]
MKNKTTLLIAFVLAIFTTTTSFGQLVTSSADDGSPGTLRVEVANAAAGSTVTFDPAVTAITLISGEILIDKNLTISGASSSTISVDANNTGRIFNITAGSVVLENLNLTNGLADNGGAIFISNASVTISDSVLTGNIANGTPGSGGAIFNDVGGVLIVNDTEISSNQANRAGGGIEDNSGTGLAITLNNVNLDNNNAGVAPATAAPGNGGGLHITGPGSAIVNDGTVIGNTAAREGGGLWNGSGLLDLNGVTISGNSAVGDVTGGGALFNNGSGTIDIDATTTLTGNIAMGATPGGRGGAIFNNVDGILNLANGLSITGNYASRAGGGIEDSSGGTLTLDGVTLTGNSAGMDIGLGAMANPGNGGAVHLSGTTNATVSGFSTISNNLAAIEGGGLWNNLGTMDVSFTFLDNNIASGDAADDGGGAIFNNGGTLVVGNASALTNNIADGTAGSGGAILSTDGSVNIIDAVLAFNRSNRAGGAIEIIDGSIAMSGNFNINGNNTGVAPAVASPGNGGGLHISGSGTAVITGGTISNNMAAREGGGLWNSTAAMTVNGTTLNGNDAQGVTANDGGGAIFNNGGTLTVENGTTITNNTATGTSGSGGGIMSTDGIVTVVGSTITSNTSNRAGGGIELIEGTLNLTSTTLNSNATGSAPGNGGGLHITGAANSNITGGTVNMNTAAREGGGLWNGSGIMTVDGVIIDGNTASGPASDDGGAGIFNNGGTLVVQNMTTISNNIVDGASGSGGGVFSTGGDVTVNGSSITMNQANRAGGGIELAGGILNLVNVTLDNNNAGVLPAVAAPGSGGGLHVTGSATTNITGGTTNGNSAANEGGGLWNGSGIMTVSNHAVDGNTASGNDGTTPGAAGGGGIYNEGGTLNLSGSTSIVNNVADGAQSTGGGILNAAGTLNADGIIIMDNTANRAGGGIETNGGGAVTLTNVSLNSNDAGIVTGAGAPGNGGGLHVSGNSAITLTGGTVNMNTAASEGGGLWNGMGTLTIDGTTIDANTASGATASEGGGGIYALTNGTVNLVNGAIVSNNIADGTSGSGGGILVDGASLNVDGSSIIGNQANRAGGGIEIVAGAGTIMLINTTLDNNNAGVSPAVAAPGSGGGLHISGAQDISISGGTANGNSAANEGGGLWNGSGIMTVSNYTVDGNTASGNDGTTPGAAGGGGIYNEGGTLDLSGTTAIINNVADGAQSTGGGILNAAGTLIADGITIMDNTANRAGGGIETNGGGAVTLTNVSLNSNDAGIVTGAGAPGNGGGLHVSGNSTVTLIDGTVNMNTAASEGGGLWNGMGTLTIDGTTIDANTASGATASEGGGGIYALSNGTVILVNGATVSNNIADGASGSGGGILVDADASFSAIDSFITGNRANRAGGGIEVVAGIGTALLSNTALNNNNAGVSPAVAAPGNGGGLHISGMQDFTITGGTVNGNSAGREGAGLWNGTGVMLVDGVTIDANIALGSAANQGGAGIFNNGGTLNVVNGTIVSNNMSTGTSASGGGLLSTAGAVTITDSTFDSNAANRAGGAIEVIDGTLIFMSSSMLNNDVNGTAGTAAPGNGGGLHVTGTSGTVSIDTSTISGNAAANEGGGIYNNTGSITTVMRSTISGNTATVSGGGLTNNGASLDLNAVTVAFNTSMGIAGGVDAVNTVTLKNTIVALNTATSGIDVSGVLVSNNYNLIGMDDLNVFSAAANDIEGMDPLLGALQDNGGTTLTHNLLDSSPAFDAGDSADTFTDQIGQSVFGASRDIGAYESQVTLSVDDLNLSSTFNMFPNPSNGTININLDNTISGEIKMEIVSITGQVIKTMALSSGNNRLDVSELSSGIYVINIRTANNSISKKLVLN